MCGGVLLGVNWGAVFFGNKVFGMEGGNLMYTLSRRVEFLNFAAC